MVGGPIVTRDGVLYGNSLVLINFYRILTIQGERHDLEILGSQDHEDKRTYITRYHTIGHDYNKKGRRKELPFVFEVQYSKTCVKRPLKNRQSKRS